MKTLLFFSLLATTLLDGLGQNQYNIWYFGNRAGIDFNSGTATLITNSSMQSFEGTTMICDSAGEILFYSNGGKLLTGFGTFHGGVWNRDHQLMPHGNLDSTGGCNSSSQGCLIVPDPADDKEYYLFTVDCFENSYVGGFRYSKIDMALDGGLGDVTLKNVLILDTVTESICGIKHSNGRDYWVVVHRRSTPDFYAYLINSSGIQAPVISSIGNPPSGNVGQMQASIDGSYIAYPITYETMLFDFNNTSGVLSNYRNLNKYSFACAFSPSCQFLYTLSNDPPDTKLYQFDLQAMNIPGSAVEIGSVTSPYRPLQLAPDGKIYFPNGIMNSTSLSVINFPDNAGIACNLQLDAFSLDTFSTSGSLPNIISGLYGECGFTISNIQNPVNYSSWHVSPNPVTDIMRVGLPAEAEIHYRIIDLTGQEIQSGFSTNDCIVINGIPAGFYFLIIEFAQEKLVSRFIKQ